MVILLLLLWDISFCIERTDYKIILKNSSDWVSLILELILVG